MTNKHMNRYLLSIIILVFVITSNVICQDFPSQIFHDGKVILQSGDTLKGKTKYDMQNDMVQLVSGNVVHTLTARKIIYFTIFDETVDMYRTFYSLPYNIQPDYRVPMLFEVLYEGELSLLARESIVQETVPQYSNLYRSSVNMTRTKLSYEYFFLEKKGTFTKYNTKKNELYGIMRKRSQQIKQYVKKNHLKTDLRRDLVRITAYYNAIL